jgi:ElaB/YqjD/DUF883 family membrane-anchored ribosome-binding protein
MVTDTTADSTTGTSTGGTSTAGTTQEKLTNAAAPYIDKAKGFAKERPFAAAALAGVVGIALLNTLRGK